jgi:hypothetical protein
MDNCPAWPNPDQELPPWPVPAGDLDCDGYVTVTESSVGTDPVSHCASTTTPNDEQTDAWPADADDDQDADIGDIIKLFFDRILKPSGYSSRADIDGDGDIDVGDLIALIGGIGGKLGTCS